MQTLRDIIFVSHANPEDNIFTTWLCAQLANAGYKVWSDITQLLGGENTWEHIEPIIRDHAAKFLFVITDKAQQKDGVKDELNLGITIERSQKLEDFVVPIRLEPIPYANLQININRKNAIDFSESWTDGLEKLLKKLEKDNVPKNPDGYSNVVATWYDKNLRSSATPAQQEETIVSNWLPIISLPEHVYFSNFNVVNTQIDNVATTATIPFFRYQRHVGSFASASEWDEKIAPSVTATPEYSIPTKDFTERGFVGKSGLSTQVAKNNVVNLLRQTWDNYLRSRGLLSHEMAVGNVTWFVPNGLISDKITFTPPSSKQRKKGLTGQSKVNNVFWHFGISIKPFFRDGMPYFLLRSHVIFTTDGKTPLNDKEKMHSLRRKFCRSWWNDQWRDLILSFLAWLSEGNEIIYLPISSQTCIQVSSNVMLLKSPVTYITDEDSEALNEYNYEDDETDDEVISEEVIAKEAEEVIA